jgi:PhnB protein
MGDSLPHVRHGFGALRPYIYGHLDLLDLVTNAFGAEVVEKIETNGGFHVEARIRTNRIGSAAQA